MSDTAHSKTFTSRFGRPSGWSVVAMAIAVVVLTPIAAVVWLALFPAENIWAHLIATTLPRYLTNSIVMMASVGLISVIVGTGTAWLVVMYRFPARGVLQWALLLPLALPAYIGAYALVDFWEYAGPFQTWLRGLFGWTSPQDYVFPQVRSRGAAVLVLAASLYPYVYFLARAAFREQSGAALEVSRALGCGPWSSFWRVGLPLARPAIVAGCAVVMMETLNDFGAVEFFAVQTLTTGIFTVWLEASNAGGAAQIACLILMFVLMLVTLEKLSRRRIKFHETAKQKRPLVPTDLDRGRAVLAVLACAVPVIVGFVMPVAIMAEHALTTGVGWGQPQLGQAVLTTLRVSGLAALITVLAGLILVYGVRLSASRLPRLLAPVTTIGYAAPGAVLALGILLPLAALDHRLADAWLALTGSDPGLLITGTSLVVILAYSVRFFAIAFGSIDAAFGRVTPNMGWASRSLGQSAGATLWRVHVPIIRGSLLTAGLLIFVDCVKELPATLLLRPFGMDTLATHVYDHASLEDIEGAAPASLMIVMVSLIAVAIVATATRSRR
ncbi:MAG: iron ABC transporter permease [Rhodobacteraceae bacterium]|nr:iron ABC transporter permease [Paracoccaceae bacterium]